MGWLHAITGPMFSGKTDFLIRELKMHEIKGKDFTIFRPTIDTRTEGLVSRSGLQYLDKTVSVPGIVDIANFYFQYKPDIVAIDEAQFIKGVGNIAGQMANYGSLVYVSGLDKDFRGATFGDMDQVLVQADQVTKLSAICFTCKKKAGRTQRLIDGKPATRHDPIILIGGMGDETYEARCREHWEYEY